MGQQLYFEDIAVGQDIPQLVKNRTPRQLVKWAGASGDYNELHYDQAVATAQGLPGIIVHGRVKAAFLAKLVTDWIGPEGVLREVTDVRYREPDFPSRQLTCGGKVTAKSSKDGDNLVECEVWTQNPEGRKTTTGAATFTVPSRG